MRVSAARNRPVIDTSSAATIGRVQAFVIDLAGPRIAGVTVKGAPSDTPYLAWEDVQAFGADAVTVSDAGVLRAAPDGLPRDHAVLGKRVLSEHGNLVGEAADIEFDEQSGTLHGVVIGGQGVADGTLIGAGGYAVVLAGSPAPGDPEATVGGSG